MKGEEFINSIDDMGQVFTIGMWHGGPNHTWNVRYIYIHKTSQLLDMREDKHFKIFMEIFPEDLQKKIAILVSSAPFLDEVGEGRENIMSYPLYEEDLGQFSKDFLDKLKIKRID